MYALLNEKTGKFFRMENRYGVCIEVDTFIEAKTFKTKEAARYANVDLKNDYIVISFEEALVKELVY